MPLEMLWSLIKAHMRQEKREKPGQRDKPGEREREKEKEKERQDHGSQIQTATKSHSETAEDFERQRERHCCRESVPEFNF